MNEWAYLEIMFDALDASPRALPVATATYSPMARAT
jgi:hypothetical protein